MKHGVNYSQSIYNRNYLLMLFSCRLFSYFYALGSTEWRWYIKIVT